MSIRKMIDGLPQCEGRRGLLVAIEGPKLAGKTYLINKIKEHLGTEDIVVIDDNTVVIEGKNNTFDSLFYLSFLHETTPIIEKALGEGKCVLIESYILEWLACSYNMNAFKCQSMSKNRAISTLAAFLKDLIVPDLTLYLEPDTDKLVTRYIADGHIEDDKQYMFSKQRRFVDAFGIFVDSRILENVVPLIHDPITKETDAINLITMKAAMDTVNLPIRYF